MWGALIRATTALGALVLVAAVARWMFHGQWTRLPHAVTVVAVALLALTLVVAVIDRRLAHDVIVIRDNDRALAVVPMIYLGDVDAAFPQLVASTACHVGRGQPVIWTINTTAGAVRSETVIYRGDSGAQRDLKPEVLDIPPGNAAPFHDARDVLVGHP